jgi:SAM-dependent methyltransferase
MNSITQGIGNFYLYITEAFLEQDKVTQEESAKPSYQMIVISFLVATAGGYVIKKLMNTIYQPIKDTPKLFWKELEESQRPSLPLGPVIIMGKVLADDLSSLQKQMFSSCDRMSQLFVEYIQIKGLKPKNVLDLGCGVGANSIPLLKYGVNVIAIDNMKCLLDTYQSRIKNKEKKCVSLKEADLTALEKYSTEDNIVDVALAIDVLPYLPISCWKSTIEKIVVSLKPGGYFFGTLFVKKAWFNHPVVAVHERLGAQYFDILLSLKGEDSYGGQLETN